MTRALLVIDVQESFRARAEWADVANPAVADKVAELVGDAVGRGAKRIVVPVRPGKSRLSLRLILTAGGKRGEQWVVITR